MDGYIHAGVQPSRHHSAYIQAYQKKLNIFEDLCNPVIVQRLNNQMRSELENISAGKFKQGSVPPFWDGRAAERIVADIEAFLS